MGSYWALPSYELQKALHDATRPRLSLCPAEGFDVITPFHEFGGKSAMGG
jgi:hypothetical protein